MTNMTETYFVYFKSEVHDVLASKCMETVQEIQSKDMKSIIYGNGSDDKGFRENLL